MKKEFVPSLTRNAPTKKSRPKAGPLPPNLTKKAEKTVEDVEVPEYPKIKIVKEDFNLFKAFGPKKDVFAENTYKMFWAQLIFALFIFGSGVLVGLAVRILF